MSLLLDALKKAAEKKAKKSAEEAQGIENTELDTDSIQQSASQTEDSTKTTPFTDSTQVDATEIDRTDIDTTQIDSTEMDITDIASSDSDKTDIDSTEIRASSLDVTDIEATQLDQTELDITDITATDDDATEIDSTDIKTNALDLADDEATHIDRTELDITDIAATDDDKTDIDSTDVKTAALDMTDMESTQVDSTELDQSNYTDTHARTDYTDTETLTGKDKTLLFFEDDEDAVELGASKDQDDKTQTQITETNRIQSRWPQQEGDILTQDDVTEFMGDGLTAKEVEENSIPGAAAQELGTDDTTITNRDSLSLTNIDYDDMSLEQQEETGYPMAEDDSPTNKPSQYGYDGRVSSDQDSHDFQLEDISEHGQTTVSNADATAATIDIEKLTSDETVTIKDSTATRTFAPDNYDRTLLKLADSDVSKIFPGLKPETDTVMTPDYAKKVFLNKSHGVKHSSYKMYVGIALLILITVSVLGLFELQDESDLIDSSLLGLKRDPMPGVIKPKNIEQSTILFPAQSTQGDEKALDIIATADEVDESQTDALIEQQSPETEQTATLDRTAESGSAQQQQSASDSESEAIAAETDTGAAAGGSADVAQNNLPTPPDKQQAEAPSSAQSGLKITSTSQVSEKDSILLSAYKAYEEGNLPVAGRLYDQVLSLQPEDRDALLGRAAIHVKENEAEKALQYYQKLLEANPKDSMALTSLISVVNIDPQAGETQIKSLLREQPDAPYLHFTLGNMYGSQKRWAEAQSAYFTALQYKPNDPNYAYNLAVSLEHIQKPDTAITFYQRALENNSYGQASFDSQLVGQRIEVLSQ